MATVFVLVSERDVLPTVIIEAMACGTHVVSVNCDFGPREILKSDSLVDQNNIEELSKK
jgi:glycosyltransferase involved in cell wall biosynthesis